MLRKFPASNAFVASFKNANFSQSSLKVTKLSEFQHFFSYLKFFSLFIINGSLFSLLMVLIISCEAWHTC